MELGSLRKKAAASLCAAVLFLSDVTATAQSTEGPPQRVIVKWKDNPSAGARGTSAAGALERAGSRSGVSINPVRGMATGAEVMRTSRRLSKAEMTDMLQTLNADPGVEYAEEDVLLKPFFTPDDPRYSEQWSYYESVGGVNLPGAWDIANGSGVIVAVIDTGYRPHADLAANIVGGYDFISDTFVSRDGNSRDSDASDPGDWRSATDCPPAPADSSSWHGTHVAGTIAAVTNNGNGVAGVAYGAKVLPLRVLGRCGGYTADIADAIIWASGGSVSGVPANPNVAKVINLSLGSDPGYSCSSTEQAAINSARSRGSVVIVAAGNDNVNASLVTPANCSGVVVVAAVGRNGGKASYSNYGSAIDVAAPGGSFSGNSANDILSTLNTGTTTPGSDSYEFYPGTSMAAPHVAGIAALMLSVNSSLTPDQIETLLKSSTRSFPTTCNQCGTGIVNAQAAVVAASGNVPPPGPDPGSGTVLANGVPVSGLSGSAGAERRYTLVVPSGASNLRIAISGGSGDADLYVGIGFPPTTSSYSCRPFRNGNDETCTASAPSPNTYYILVRGYSSYSGVTLTGSYTP